jgi:hypothetical protein
MDKPGQTLAVTAETLFLVNLLLAPGLAFLVLLILYLRYRGNAEPLAANHLSQTVGVGLIGGSLLVCITGLIALLGGLDSGYTWVVVVLYFTFIHSTLILLGILGLVKALAGQQYRYPLLGRWFRP